MILHLKEIKSALELAQTQGISMRHRLMLYLFAFMLFFALLITMLLFLFGAIDPIGSEMERALKNQLENSANFIEEQSNNQAAYAVAFSQQLTAAVRDELTDSGITFDQLHNNPDALTSMQDRIFEIVYNNMQLVPCSGAFCFLNTTVNDTLPDESYQGLYLKFANLYAENTIHNDVCLYRGFSSIARENNINLHSTWQLETRKGLFPEVDTLMSSRSDSISKAYFLTSVYRLPDTWENVRLLCIPVFDSRGTTIGVCGFEISNLYFMLSHKASETEQSHIFCALLDRSSDGYVGQIAGNQSGYFPPVDSVFTVENNLSLTVFHSGDIEFIGKMRELAVGTTTHVVAVMLPAEEYQDLVKTVQLKIAAILFIAALAILAVALWGSKKYVAPILKDLERIKDGTSPEQGSSRVLEIGDLFAFLEQQDREHEAVLSALHQEKLEAQIRQERLQNELHQANSEYESAQIEIARLAYSRKQEIDPDDFQYFLKGISQLTPAEQKVFNLYLEGKNAKEIIAILEVTENTLKFHNKNIYNKLGVSSRKQLLRYATLMKQQEENDPQ